MTSQDLAQTISKLKPGQNYRVPWRTLQTITMNPLENTYDFPIRDWVLEQIIGSAYEFGYYEDVHHDIVYFRLPQPLDDGRLSYVSPDRRDRYRKTIDGVYELK